MLGSETHTELEQNPHTHIISSTLNIHTISSAFILLVQLTELRLNRAFGKALINTAAAEEKNQQKKPQQPMVSHTGDQFILVYEFSTA